MVRTRIYDMCLEEYKIIQAKIDKIGEFKFKVRGWSFTLESAALAGLFTHDLPLAVSVGFFVVLGLSVFFFHYLEQEQVVLVSALSDRATTLEKTLSRLSLPTKDADSGSFMRLLLKELEGAPKIAVILRNESRRGIRHLLRSMKNFKKNIFFYFQYFILLLGAGIYCYVYVKKNWV